MPSPSPAKRFTAPDPTLYAATSAPAPGGGMGTGMGMPPKPPSTSMTTDGGVLAPQGLQGSPSESDATGPGFTRSMLRAMWEAGVPLPAGLRPTTDELELTPADRAREAEDARHSAELEAAAPTQASAPTPSEVPDPQAAWFAEQQERDRRDLAWWVRTQGMELPTAEGNSIVPAAAGAMVTASPLDDLPPLIRDQRLANYADLAANGRADLIPADLVPAVTAFIARSRPR